MIKKVKEKIEIGSGGWAFATINGKLSEFFFSNKKGKSTIYAHCYVKLEEYKEKWEKKATQEDTAKYRFVWRNKEYKQVPPKTI